MAGSGKSTVAKQLAQKFDLQYLSGGDALKAMAMEEGYKNIERGWWESAEGLRFLEKRNRNPEFDKEIDEKFIELAQHGNVVLDSWTMPWLLKGGFKIWLEASTEVRAKRIAHRDDTNLEEALTALKNKETQTKNIYKKLYGFSLGEDFAPFHLILDTDSLKPDEVYQILCTVISNMLLK
jgi:cytidylate kinase